MSSAPADLSTAARVWRDAPQIGILVVGDAALRERAVEELVAAVDRPVRRVTVGADPGQLQVTDHCDAVTVCVAAELLDPEQVTVMVDASCPLVSAVSLDEVPDAILDCCTLVLELDHTPDGLLQWDEPLFGFATSVSGPVNPLATAEVVALATAHGISCHRVEIGATLAARVAARQGLAAPTVEQVLDRFVLTPRSGGREPSRTQQSIQTDQEQADQEQPDQEQADQEQTDQDHRGAQEPSAGDGTDRPPSEEGTDPVDTAEPEPEPAPAAMPMTAAAGRGRHRARTAPTGRGGPVTATRVGGRPDRVITSPRPDTGFALPATLLRVASRAVAGGGPVRASAEDLRWCHRRRRSGRLTVIVVDASGSMGRDALRQAKAIALGLLDQAYRRRDRVAVVLVRGRDAQLGLPPTKSLARVRDSLRRLPHGGGTPLASGLLLACELARPWDPAAVEVVVLTDGRANIALPERADNPEGAGSLEQSPRHRARADAVRVAGLLHHRAGTRVVHGLSRGGVEDSAGWLRDALAVCS